jgi:hypothetical protein
MQKSGQSEMLGVADILETIAANGDESETDEFLVACAGEIIGAAAYFIEQVQGQPLMLYTVIEVDSDGSPDVIFASLNEAEQHRFWLERLAGLARDEGLEFSDEAALLDWYGTYQENKYGVVTYHMSDIPLGQLN